VVRVEVYIGVLQLLLTDLFVLLDLFIGHESLGFIVGDVKWAGLTLEHSNSSCDSLRWREAFKDFSSQFLLHFDFTLRVVVKVSLHLGEVIHQARMVFVFLRQAIHKASV
jgi:hypothetical protein